LVFLPALARLPGQQGKPDMFGNAEAYERFMGRWSRLVAPAFAGFASPRGDGRVLDIGSGTGSLTFSILDRNPRSQVVGIDPSTEYVAYAKSRNSFGNRASFETGDAQAMRFRDREFDAALSLLVWNFIPDPKKALLEARRVVKPGGTIAAAVWDYGDRMRMLRVFWDAVVAVDPAAAKRDEKNMPLCRSGELAQLWRDAGLAEVREQPIEVETRFPSFTDYWESFRLGQGPAGAYVAALPPAKAETLRTEVKRRLAVASESAPFSLPARVWAVRGNVVTEK
jgi:ubiquinone/menaquinone biosynthesis C-methylase UbiE